MSSDGILRRMPASIRQGNGIKVTANGGSFTISADLQTQTVTPAGMSAPVLLADTLAQLIAHDSAQRYINTIDGGFFDIPGTGSLVTIDGGWF